MIMLLPTVNFLSRKKMKTWLAQPHSQSLPGIITIRLESISIKLDLCKIEIAILEFSELTINLFLMKKVGVYKKYIL